MSETLTKTLSKQPLAEMLGCRDALVAKPGDGKHPVFGWEYDEKTHLMKPVITGEEDFQEIVDQGKGMDIRSIINRQPGNTPQERLANAVDAGLINIGTPATEDTDLTELPKDKAEAVKAMVRAKSQAAALNAELGTDYDIEEILKGKAQKAIDDYIAKKMEGLKAQAIQEGVKDNG